MIFMIYESSRALFFYGVRALQRPFRKRIGAGKPHAAQTLSVGDEVLEHLDPVGARDRVMERGTPS
jgi:hypothetical protein